MTPVGNDVIFIGLMGSGKSTIGKLLASRLSLSFVDLDKVIVSQEGITIPDIFGTVGEAGFRKLESKCLAEVLRKSKSQVIATGGGAILSEANRELMKQSGIIVWLDADVEVLAKRITGDSNRPLLHDVNPLEKMKALTEQRNPWYAEIADLHLDTGKLSAKEAVDKIAAFLSE